ncbi:hypothetical protein CC2G_005226 [Coprinopsis cinerea AmutBmut pab1-1]|nr:hypothetical protein CC2G_005226 [Coprinopsis cinerea AmutBmut pab1-1]
MGSKRWVVLDDLDAEITYEGPWFTVYDSFSTSGENGPTYMSSSHGTNGTARATFNFDGSTMILYGGSDVRNSSGLLDPTWDCLVDGVSIGRSGPSPFGHQNNWELCLFDGPQGKHRLEVQIVSQGRTFWLDRIIYVPSPRSKVQSPVVMLQNGDPSIKLEGNWTSALITAALTHEEGSMAEVEFVGTRLTWVGYIPGEFPGNPASGTYAIDGNEPTTFALRGLLPQGDPPEILPLYHQTFIQTPELPLGPHKVTVVYHGDASVTPLTLSHIYIQDGNVTVPAPGETSIFDAPAPSESSPGAPSSPSSSSPEPSSPPTTDRASNTPNGMSVGAIVGGAVGALFLLILSAFMVVYLQRRYSNSNSPSRVESGAPSSSARPEPFDVAPCFSEDEHRIPGVRPLVSYHPPVKGRVVSVSGIRAERDASAPSGASRSQDSAAQGGNGLIGSGRGSGVSPREGSGATVPSEAVDVLPMYSVM